MPINVDRPGVYLTLGGDLAYIMFTNKGSSAESPVKGFAKIRGTSEYQYSEWDSDGLYDKADPEHKNTLIRFLQEFS